MDHIVVRCALLVVALALAAVVHGGEIYRWVDDDGKVHFSDKAPPDQQADEISENTRPVNIDESQHEREKLRRVFAPETPEEQQLKQQQTAVEQRQRQQQQQQCSEARRLLKMISEERFYAIDADGKERDVSKEEARQKKAELQDFIAKHC